MKTLKLEKYRTNCNGNLRSATESLAVNVSKIVEYYSFKTNDKEGTVVVTEAGEHHVREPFEDVSSKIRAVERVRK